MQLKQGGGQLGTSLRNKVIHRFNGDKLGNVNTSYFHKIASRRKLRMAINHMEVNNIQTQNQDEITEVFTTLYTIKR